MSSDSEIIERSRDTPGVFAGLYERHAGTIYRYAARRIGVGVADDVMSETFPSHSNAVPRSIRRSVPHSLGYTGSRPR